MFDFDTWFLKKPGKTGFSGHQNRRTTTDSQQGPDFAKHYKTGVSPRQMASILFFSVPMTSPKGNMSINSSRLPKEIPIATSLETLSMGGRYGSNL